jgi:hypothetical protein
MHRVGEHGQSLLQPDRLVTQVYELAMNECRDTSCPIEAQLWSCAVRAVSRFAEVPVRTFVPLLALREVRECVRNGACPDLEGIEA